MYNDCLFISNGVYLGLLYFLPTKVCFLHWPFKGSFGFIYYFFLFVIFFSSLICLYSSVECLGFYFYFFVFLFFFIFIFKIYLFIYLFLAVLGLCFCVRAFSSCGKRGPLFIAVCGPLTIAASLVAVHRLQMRRLSSCGSRA